MSDTTRKETISRSAESKYTHKKQLGGAGEFSEVTLRLDPLPRGSGVSFANEVSSGSIPRDFVPAIEASVRRCAEAGGYSGYPVTDLRVALIDGKYHEVDSNGKTFAIAAEHAFYDALHKGNSRLVI